VLTALSKSIAVIAFTQSVSKETMTTESAAVLPQQGTSPIALKIAVAVFAITSATLAALYYQASRDLDAQKASVASLQLEIAKELARAAELNSDLHAAQSEAQAHAKESAQLSSEVASKNEALAAEKTKAETVQAALDQEKARLPAVPIRIEVRRSAMGRGLVAMFTNTSARQLPVMLATHNPTTGVAKEKSLQIAPGKKVEIGYLEGIQFASGDEVVLRSAGFDEVHYTVQ
jgi:uncharacterized membrane-anchored protein YhcB (DUF1043 family)